MSAIQTLKSILASEETNNEEKKNAILHLIQEEGENFNPLARDEKGNTLLQIYCQYRNDYNDPSLFNESAVIEVMNAVLEGKSEEEAQAILNAQNNQGKALIHLAVEEGYPNLVVALAGKANFNIPDAKGNTALHLAASAGHNSMLGLAGTRERFIEPLITGGANLFATNQKRQKPLDVAVGFAKVEIERREQAHPGSAAAGLQTRRLSAEQREQSGSL